jgi:hypothetical protein
MGTVRSSRLAIWSHRARRLSRSSSVSGTSFKWLVFRRGERPAVTSGPDDISVVLSPVDNPCTSVVARDGVVSDDGQRHRGQSDSTWSAVALRNFPKAAVEKISG